MPGQPGTAGFAASIVAIAERGDRAAFSELFSHFAPRVKSYLLCLGASAESAEELAQETLLIVWRRATAFDPGRAAPSTWIFTIARNLRFDALRREKRPTMVGDPSDPVIDPATPDAILAGLLDETRIGRALEDLPADQARVVRLAFLSDQPQSEIAVELCLPLGAVKSHLRLAMGRLRATLGEAA
ncbi:MAG: sigma-70 family RNA polymerase sigma factor [Pseudomonadota bacterium]